MDISADATPVVVYRTANSENDTPKNGPKNAPTDSRFMALPFFKAENSMFHLFRNRKISANPATPVITLI